MSDLFKKRWSAIRRGLPCALAVLALVVFWPAAAGADSEALRQAGFEPAEARHVAWRVRILEAAVVRGAMVTLGEIGAPAGDMPPGLWERLSPLELWAAPEESGKPTNLTRPRLQQAMLESLGSDFASLCLYPPSLAIQRGGSVLAAAAVQEVVVKGLTPLLGTLPGEGALTDFRLPGLVFLSRPGQELALEAPRSLSPGRLSLRLDVREPDGRVVKRLTGTVMVECWATVPCASVPLNRGDTLGPDKITFMRKNLAQARETIWDGKGGPWRLIRPVLPEQPILLGDLTHVPTVTKGSIVNLVYQSANLRLAVKAEALADGVKGEVIPMRNPGSRKQIYATIRDEGLAVIEAGHFAGLGEEPGGEPGEKPEAYETARASLPAGSGYQEKFFSDDNQERMK